MHISRVYFLASKTCTEFVIEGGKHSDQWDQLAAEKLILATFFSRHSIRSRSLLLLVGQWDKKL